MYVACSVDIDAEPEGFLFGVFVCVCVCEAVREGESVVEEG